MNPALIQHLQEATELFALVVTLCVLVTGFFLGRHWLKKISGETPSSGPSSKDVYKYWRSSGHSPADMHKMRGGWRNL